MRGASLVLVLWLACLAAATEKVSEKVVEKIDKPEKVRSSSISSLNTSSSQSPRQARARGSSKDAPVSKPTRSTANSEAVPAAATTAPASALASAPSAGAFTSSADSPYAHLFHPSAIDLSSFFSPQFLNPSKQQQLDLSSIYAQYPSAQGQQAYNPPQQNYNQGFNLQQGLRQGNDVVYQSQHPASPQDYNLVYQTIRKNPVVFPTSRPTTRPAHQVDIRPAHQVPGNQVSNDYSTVYQAQRPNLSNTRGKPPKPIKLSATYQSQRPPTPAEYASVYQKTPTVPPTAPSQQAGVNLGSLYLAQPGQSTQPQGGSEGPQNVKLDVNQLVNTQVLPQIQGGAGIQLLDLSDFYAAQGQQGQGKPQQQQFYQVTGGKNLVQVNPALYQQLQQASPPTPQDNRHADQASPAQPTLSPEQLEAFYKSIGAQPPPKPSPSSAPSAPASNSGYSPSPTPYSPALSPTQASQLAYNPTQGTHVPYDPAQGPYIPAQSPHAVYQTPVAYHPSQATPVAYTPSQATPVAYSPAQAQPGAYSSAPGSQAAYVPAQASYNPASQVSYNPNPSAQFAQYNGAQYTPSSGLQYSPAPYTTVRGQQTQAVAPQQSPELAAYYNALSAARVQAQGQVQTNTAQIHPAELAAIYRQQQLPQQGQGGGGGAGVVYVPTGQDPRELYAFSGQSQSQAPSQQQPLRQGPTSSVYFGTPQYQQSRPSGYTPPSSIASLISQLAKGESDHLLSPSPTAPAYVASTPTPKRPSRPSRPSRPHKYNSPPPVSPTPNPTPSALPSKYKQQLVKKPHNFGHGYSFEITG